MLEVLEKRHHGAQCDRFRGRGSSEMSRTVAASSTTEGTGSVKRSFFTKSVTTKDKDAAVFTKVQVAI